MKNIKATFSDSILDSKKMSLDLTTIFKDNSIDIKLNDKNSIDGLELLKNVVPESASIVFFDPQYRGVLDKLNYGNEGKKQIKRSLLPQMTEIVIKNFILEISTVLKKSGHLFL
jgi:site-specific DNA-methyltransferase (adenine-specific)